MTGVGDRIGWRDLLARATERGRILVVDDEAAVRRGLQRLVTGFGYLAKSAASAEEADRMLNEERFEVCLLDIELPRMTGIEFLEWALKRDAEMAVIMLSGLDAPELAKECIENGARSYLVKPVVPEFLRLALRDATAMRRLLVERNDRAEGLEAT